MIDLTPEIEALLSRFSVEERALLMQEFAVKSRGKNKHGMYGKLQAFFESVPQLQEQVALNFSDFTAIMGHDLPKTALKDRTWWANTESPHGGSWLSAGWKLENIYLHAKIAIFRRKAENPLKSIPK